MQQRPLTDAELEAIKAMDREAPPEALGWVVNMRAIPVRAIIEELEASRAVVKAVRAMRAEAYLYNNWYTFVTCEYGEAVDEALAGAQADTVRFSGDDQSPEQPLEWLIEDLRAKLVFKTDIMARMDADGAKVIKERDRLRELTVKAAALAEAAKLVRLLLRDMTHESFSLQQLGKALAEWEKELGA